MGNLLDLALLAGLFLFLRPEEAPHAENTSTVMEIASADAILSVSPAQIADASPSFDPSYSVRFALRHEAAATMAELTGGAIGEVISIGVCGEVLVEPVVRDQLFGVGLLTVDSREEAVRVAEILRGERRCPGPPLLLSAPSGTAEIPSDGVLGARAYLNDRDLPTIEITLDEDASRTLAEMTGRNIGEPMAIARCDAVLTEPVVMSPITGPELLITGGPSYAAARDLAAAIESSAPCP